MSNVTSAGTAVSDWAQVTITELLSQWLVYLVLEFLGKECCNWQVCPWCPR